MTWKPCREKFTVRVEIACIGSCVEKKKYHKYDILHKEFIFYPRILCTKSNGKTCTF